VLSFIPFPYSAPITLWVGGGGGGQTIVGIVERLVVVRGGEFRQVDCFTTMV
jgi:hypothetical protein